MALYAVDDLDDAYAATRAFLLPFDLRTWLKLAVVVLFLGGVGANSGANIGSSGGSGTGFTFPAGTTFPANAMEVFAVIAIVVAVILVVALLFAAVGAIMEFVFVESLRSEAVHVRRYGRQHLGKGLRLLGFRLVLGVLALIGFGLAFAPLALALFNGEPATETLLASALVFLPVALLVAGVVALVSGLTTVFVVPVMLRHDVGVVAGWRRFWPTLRHEWQQYLAYVVASVVLQFVLGLAVGILVGLLALLVLIPFGLVGALLVGVVVAADGFTLLTGVLFGALVFLFVLVVVAVAAIVQVPVQTYLRYYALFVLGDTDDDLDLIPERRATVRAGEETPDAA